MSDCNSISTKKCLICKDGKKNDCLHWHIDPETKDIWVFCVGVCQRGYSLREYCHTAGIPLNEFLKGEFDFQESRSNEVNQIEFPSHYLTLSDPRAKDGVEYIRSRGLRLDGDVYYDSERRGIVFPYYFDNAFVGAQTRFLEPRIWKDGTVQKIDTTPGTRLGLLFGLWNQTPMMPQIKNIVICEGYFNALCLQQAFNDVYGSVATNPWKFICTSGAGISSHQAEKIRELKDKGYKVISALDGDEAGLKGFKKLNKLNAITHYAIPEDTDLDWNDYLKQFGHRGLAKYFLSLVKKI